MNWPLTRVQPVEFSNCFDLRRNPDHAKNRAQSPGHHTIICIFQKRYVNTLSLAIPKNDAWQHIETRAFQPSENLQLTEMVIGILLALKLVSAQVDVAIFP